VKLSTKSTTHCGKVRSAIANLFTSNAKSSHVATSQTPLNIFSLLHSNNCSNELSISHRLSLSRHLNDEDETNLSEFETSEDVEAIFCIGLSNQRFGSASEARFCIEPGSFYDCIIPENIKSLWGPIPLQSLPPGVENKFRAVAHG
jgi:hypothetical protein